MPQMGPWTVSAENAVRITNSLRGEMAEEDGDTFPIYMNRWLRDVLKNRVHTYEQRAAAIAVTPDDGVIDA